MTLLNIYVVTFNCARVLVQVDEFARHLFTPCQEANVWPDLIVFSLQEIAPVAHSFLGGSLLAPYLTRIIAAVHKASAGTGVDYHHLTSQNLGMTGMIVLGRPEIIAKVEKISTAGVGFGRLEMGNKGATAVRLTLDAATPSLTFVAAHLAPMEEAYRERNQNWQDLVRGLAFTTASQEKVVKLREEATNDAGQDDAIPLLDDVSSSGVEGLFDPPSAVFLAGDLNYRTHDSKPDPSNKEMYPQPGPENTALLEEWKAQDQLSRERRANRTLHNLDEAPITFPPTYKYSTSPSQVELWPKDGSEPARWLWSTHRYPSWCDRVLYSSFLSNAPDSLNILKYTALPLPPTSDHRPVAWLGVVDLGKVHNDVSALSTEDFDTPFHLDAKWRVKRAAARRKEVAVGIAAYLGSTWEGNGILLATMMGALGGWYILSAIAQT